MLKFFLKALTNPHGAIAQALFTLVAKQFKLPDIAKYVEEDNELDVECRELRTDHSALQELVVSMAKDMHEMENKIKNLEKDQIKQLHKRG